jgi:hypothetical protein
MSGTGWIGAAALLAATAGLGGCISTSTYGTGESPEAAILGEMTGGLAGGKREKIEYQPRAPLVMPASAAQLPAPVASADVADPQWPVDPDQTAEGPKVVDEEARGAITPEEYRRLKPLAGIGGGGSPRPPESERDWNFGAPGRSSKEQDKAFKAALDERDGVGVTGRRFLTDPPETVRAPAPTAQTEFAEIKKKRNGNILTRWFTGG